MAWLEWIAGGLGPQGSGATPESSSVTDVGEVDPLQQLPDDLATGTAGLVLIAAALALLPLCAFLVRRIAPGRRVFFARWGFSHVALVVLVFVLAQLVFSPLAMMLVDVGYSPVFAGLSTGVLVFGTAAAYIGWLAIRLDPDGMLCLGFRPDGQVRAAAAGVVSYGMMLPGYMGCMLLWPWLMKLLELEFAPQAVAVGILELSTTELLLAIPLAVAVVPFLEEYVFRGFLQPLLVQNLGDRGGVVATSAVFGALHGPSAFLPIFGLSLILGGVMLRTQRLLGPFVVHALHNGSTLALLFLSDAARGASGIPPESLLLP